MNVALAVTLLPLLPLAAFVVIGFAGRRLPRRLVAWSGCVACGAAALVAGGLLLRFLDRPPDGGALRVRLWTWVEGTGFAPQVHLHLDALSLLMVLVVTAVATLILVYSAEYMAGDESHARFFAQMNLFVASMVVLLLAGDLLLLYLGWEGVGLSSYLLIGFWHREPANTRAANKAFLMTRIGDTAFAVALFLIFDTVGTLRIDEVLARAPQAWPPGTTGAVLLAALLLGGAVGKSAQLPLQTWLPDAMAGPTPVSALLHSATMVTAGVYLIVRLHPIFTLAPAVMTAVGVVGAVTLLTAGASALVQTDIKRVLAYSTISQIGYMFLALGAGAWTAAVFHFFTHAFFKSLLFLGAGAVILALHHEQDIRRMGGLRHRLKPVFWPFLAGAASLAALPLVTAGFYSKDLILAEVWSRPGGAWLGVAGLVGALLTALYTFRLVFLVFFGNDPGPRAVAHPPGLRITAPLALLALGALGAGSLETPANLGHVTAFGRFLAPVLGPPAAAAAEGIGLWFLQLAATLAAGAGLAVAAWLWLKRRERPPAWLSGRAARTLAGFWREGWGVDKLYERALVRPMLRLASWNRGDLLDRGYDGLAALARGGHRLLARTQSGKLAAYVAWLAIGAVLLLAFMVLP